MTNTIACDSKPFNRHNFKGVVGAVLTFASPESFKREYDSFMESYFLKLGIQQPRVILKSYEILKLFGENSFDRMEFFNDFILLLQKNKVKVSIIYSTFNPNNLRQIKLYGIGSPSKPVSTPKFINMLEHYYLHIAVWSYSQKNALDGCEIFMDSFEGEITKAWRDLEKFNISILPSGDKCNHFISASDIVCKWIDKSLFLQKLKLHEKDIRLIFDNLELIDNVDYEVIYCGQPQLPFIVPIHAKKIPLHNYYKRPLIFVLHEGIMNGESKFMEGSPYWDKILFYAMKNNTGIKHISYSQDHENIKSGDHLLYFGENSKKQVDHLLSLEYNITAVDIKEL